VVTYDYYVGLDLGQRKDPTALAIVEAPIWVRSSWGVGQALPDGWVSPSDYHVNARKLFRSYEFYRGGAPSSPTLQVRELYRFPLGTSYPDIVEGVTKLMRLDPLEHNSVLLVDATGVGQPVVDQFRQAGLRPLAVTITGGREIHRDGDDLHVPKRDLITSTQVTLQAGRLKIAESLAEAATLVKELLEFRVRMTAAANDTYGAWREGQHDDLLLALAMAVWFREWHNALLDEARAARSTLQRGSVG
jgi:hypothetical protein